MKPCAIVLLVMAVTFPSALRGEVLGSATFSGSIKGTSVATSLPYVVLQIAVGTVTENIIDGPTLRWSTAWLDTSSIDTVLTAAPGSSIFATLAALLTDGQQQFAGIGCFLVLGPSSFGGSNRWDFEQRAFSLPTIDFSGSTITGFSVRLDDLVLGINTDNNSRIVEWTATWTVHGSAPVEVEPSSWGRIKAVYGL